MRVHTTSRFNFDSASRQLDTRDLHQILDTDTDMGAAWSAAVEPFVQEAMESIGIMFLGDQPGVDPTGVTECATEIQAALDAAEAAGQRVMAKPSDSYLIGSTVTISYPVDLSPALFTYTGADIAVQVGTGSPTLQQYTFNLPKITRNRTGVGWTGATLGTTGLKLLNVNGCIINIPYVNGFEIGIDCVGDAAGSVFNNIFLGAIAMNKINLQCRGINNGWWNQNQFYGGELRHDSGHGTNVPGCYHIYLVPSANGVNTNTWFGTSVENPTVEYAVYAGNGGYNQFINCRWEAGSGISPRVYWGDGAGYNMIIGGFNDMPITETFHASSLPGNSILLPKQRIWRSAKTAGTDTWENSGSSANPNHVFLRAGGSGNGDDPLTAWEMRHSPQALEGKRYNDLYPRVVLSHLYGRISFDNGTRDHDIVSSTTHAYISGDNNEINIGNGGINFLSDNTYDLGAASYRPRDLYVGRNARIEGALDHDGTTVGFYGTAPTTKPAVTGSRGGNAALASLLTALASQGLITDSTTA